MYHHVCVCIVSVCVCIYTYSCMCVPTWTCLCAYKLMCMHACTYMHMSVCTNMPCIGSEGRSSCSMWTCTCPKPPQGKRQEKRSMARQCPQWQAVSQESGEQRDDRLQGRHGRCQLQKDGQRTKHPAQTGTWDVNRRRGSDEQNETNAPSRRGCATPRAVSPLSWQRSTKRGTDTPFQSSWRQVPSSSESSDNSCPRQLGEVAESEPLS